MSGEVLRRAAARATLTLVLAFGGVFATLAFAPNPSAADGEQYLTRFEGVATSTEPAFARRAEPLSSALFTWIERVLTLEFGRAGPGGAPVGELVVESLAFSAVYLLPALVVAVGVGTAVQLLAVANGGRTSVATRALAVVLVSVPAFLLAFAASETVAVEVAKRFGTDVTAFDYQLELSPLAGQNLRAATFPFAAAVVYFTGIQMRYAGTELSALVDETFVRVARAKGAGRVRLAIHLFPHVAARLATALFTDTLGTFLLGVYVFEWVTGVPGFGALTIDAVGARDPGLTFAVLLLPVLVGVLASTGRELYYAFLDPRVDGG